MSEQRSRQYVVAYGTYRHEAYWRTWPLAYDDAVARFVAEQATGAWDWVRLEGQPVVMTWWPGEEAGC